MLIRSFYRAVFKEKDWTTTGKSSHDSGSTGCSLHFFGESMSNQQLLDSSVVDKECLRCFLALHLNIKGSGIRRMPGMICLMIGSTKTAVQTSLHNPTNPTLTSPHRWYYLIPAFTYCKKSRIRNKRPAWHPPTHP